MTEPTNTEQFFAAIEAGDVARVGAMVDAGMSPDSRDEHEHGALMVAAMEGHLEVVRLLLDRGADVDGFAVGAVPGSAPNDATVEDPSADDDDEEEDDEEDDDEEDDDDIFDDDLDLPMDGEDDDEEIPTPLAAASDAGHVEVVALLIERGASIAPPEAEYSALVYAARNGQAETTKLLLAHVEDLGAADGAEALVEAALGGHLTTTRLLLEAGADPNEADADGLVPLPAACVEGHLEVVKALVDAGANVNAVVDGDTALSLAALSEIDEVYEYLKPLCSAEVQEDAESRREDL